MKKILKSISFVSFMFAFIVMGFGSSIAQAETTYTLADVATHNTSSNCWVIINNNVYNLTSFIASHSGGSAVIIAQCGKNGTAAFNSGPHNANTLNAISSFLLGTVATVSPILTSLNVTPKTPSILIGSKVHLNATPKDQNDGNFSGATITFSSDNTAVATVNSTTGTVIGVTVGNAKVTATATSGDKTVTSTVNVEVTNDSISTNDREKLFEQFEIWLEQWLNDHDVKWKNKHEKHDNMRDKDHHENQGRNNHKDDDDDQEENDD